MDRHAVVQCSLLYLAVIWLLMKEFCNSPPLTSFGSWAILCFKILIAIKKQLLRPAQEINRKNIYMHLLKQVIRVLRTGERCGQTTKLASVHLLKTACTLQCSGSGLVRNSMVPTSVIRDLFCRVKLLFFCLKTDTGESWAVTSKFIASVTQSGYTEWNQFLFPTSCGDLPAGVFVSDIIVLSVKATQKSVS